MDHYACKLADTVTVALSKVWYPVLNSKRKYPAKNDVKEAKREHYLHAASLSINIFFSELDKVDQMFITLVLFRW